MAIPRLCSIPDCGKPHEAHGLCSPHYSRVRRHGDPLKGGAARTRGAQCSIDGCGKPILARNWCNAHYQRWFKYADPLPGKPSKTPNGEAQRYFREVVMTYEGDDCLTWPYGKNRQGYGYLGKQTVSRLVCEEVNGPPPTPKHQAAHSCGKGHLACVTKRHMSWKTHKGNAADRSIHGTERRGERHHAAKLTASQVREIRGLSGTATQRHLAQMFGISRQSVSEISTGKKWAHLLNETEAAQ